MKPSYGAATIQVPLEKFNDKLIYEFAEAVDELSFLTKTVHELQGKTVSFENQLDVSEEGTGMIVGNKIKIIGDEKSLRSNMQYGLEYIQEKLRNLKFSYSRYTRAN